MFSFRLICEMTNRNVDHVNSFLRSAFEKPLVNELGIFADWLEDNDESELATWMHRAAEHGEGSNEPGVWKKLKTQIEERLQHHVQELQNYLGNNYEIQFKEFAFEYDFTIWSGENARWFLIVRTDHIYISHARNYQEVFNIITRSIKEIIQRLPDSVPPVEWAKLFIMLFVAASLKTHHHDDAFYSNHSKWTTRNWLEPRLFLITHKLLNQLTEFTSIRDFYENVHSLHHFLKNHDSDFKKFYNLVGFISHLEIDLRVTVAEIKRLFPEWNVEKIMKPLFDYYEKLNQYYKDNWENYV